MLVQADFGDILILELSDQHGVEYWCGRVGDDQGTLDNREGRRGAPRGSHGRDCQGRGAHVGPLAHRPLTWRRWALRGHCSRKAGRQLD